MINPVKVGLIGDFVPDLPSHIATVDALRHTADSLSMPLKTSWIPTRSLAGSPVEGKLISFHALWGAPGDYLSMGGALHAIKYAREQGIPFIGTWAGFQHALLEYARNVLGIEDAQHEQTSPDAPTLLISKLSCSLVNTSQTITIQPDSLFSRIYDRHEVAERFVCNYGLNPKFRDAIAKRSLKIVGTDKEGEVRAIEDSDHPFYIGTLYQPQLSSNPNRPHPLIAAYLKAASNYRTTT